VNFKFPVGIFAVFSVFVLMFSACGDDSGNSASDELPESVEQFSDIKNIECNVDRECAQIYIEEHDDYVQCIDSKWETVIASKPNKVCAEAKSSSSKGKSSSSGKKQSSSSEKNSSSSVKSSSSGKANLSFDTAIDPSTVVNGTMTDERDGKTYKTVTIGRQTWMAENLNFDYNEGTAKSSCYENSADSCTKYGRRYSWAAAMDSAAKFSKSGEGCGFGKFCRIDEIVRGVCPSGWHVSTEDEWFELADNVGGFSDSAGKLLKATSGWKESLSSSGDGIDAFGFSVVPMVAAGSYAYFWITSEYEFFNGTGSSDAYYIRFESTKDNVQRKSAEKSTEKYVRCLKDSPVPIDSSRDSINDKSEYNAEKNTLTDFRDNQIYRTVKIGNQIWMAENLSFDYNEETAISSCYKVEADSCAKYGRLYNWAAAVDSCALFSDTYKGGGYASALGKNGTIRGVCPRSWHLPNENEWNILFDYFGGISDAGRNLKTTEGWAASVYGPDGNGRDSVGFSVLPAGYKERSRFERVRVSAYFWSSNDLDSYDAYIWVVNSENKSFWSTGGKSRQYSVRCLKDDDGVILSSSSVKSSSSSVALVDPSSVKKGTMTDERDGNIYKTVTIGTQTWMAENLKYDYGLSSPITYCFYDNADSCEILGRLYTWGAAMDASAIFSKAGSGCVYDSLCSPTGIVRGVCPEDWHLPTIDEWRRLFSAVGGDRIAGAKLKISDGWRYVRSGNGDDDYGFSAMPTGYFDGSFSARTSDVTFFWSSDEYSRGGAFYVSFYSYYNYVSSEAWDKRFACSVRCIKDEN
jgi:uncharacterized protein (TIGR02145 family)